MCVRGRIPLGALLKFVSVVFPRDRAHRVPRACTYAWVKTVLVACGILPRRSWLFWLRVVCYLIGVGQEPSARRDGQLANTRQPPRVLVYHADAKPTLTRGRCA